MTSMLPPMILKNALMNLIELKIREILYALNTNFKESRTDNKTNSLTRSVSTTITVEFETYEREFN